MKRIIALFAAAFLTVLPRVEARLGETSEECIARYGSPFEESQYAAKFNFKGSTLMVVLNPSTNRVGLIIIQLPPNQNLSTALRVMSLQQGGLALAHHDADADIYTDADRSIAGVVSLRAPYLVCVLDLDFVRNAPFDDGRIRSLGQTIEAAGL